MTYTALQYEDSVLPNDRTGTYNRLAGKYIHGIAACKVLDEETDTGDAPSPTLSIDRRAAEPLHRQVAKAVRRHIVDRDYASGAALPSETDLAGVFGVSRQTVRQALAQLASEGLLERVVGRGTFITTPRKARTGIVSCIVTRLHDELIARIVDGAEHVGRAAGLRLEVANALGDPDLERRCAESATVGADGVIIFATATEAATGTARMLQQGGLPFVLVDRAIASISADLVTADNVAGGALLARHLYDLGHRRVAIVRRAYDVASTVHEREQGFRSIFEDAGVPRADVPVIYAPGHLISAWDYLSLPSLADHPDVRAIAGGLAQLRPTAAFAINDITGVQTVLAAQSLGWGVPDTISVVGFGDDSQSRTCVPALTTVHQDASEMGRQAMGLLIERLAAPSLPARLVRLPVRLVQRASSGVCSAC